MFSPQNEQRKKNFLFIFIKMLRVEVRKFITLFFCCCFSHTVAVPLPPFIRSFSVVIIFFFIHLFDIQSIVFSLLKHTHSFYIIIWIFFSVSLTLSLSLLSLSPSQTMLAVIAETIQHTEFFFGQFVVECKKRNNTVRVEQRRQSKEEEETNKRESTPDEMHGRRKTISKSN